MRCSSLLLLPLGMASGAADAWSGLVEGFYWAPEHAVHGHSGGYTAAQRGQALELLKAGGLDTYVYAPQKVDLVAPLDAGEQAEWAATFAHAEALGVRFVYGVRAHHGLDVTVGGATVAAHVTAKVAQLASLGCKAYALCFDDVPGGATSWQTRLQVDLAAALQQLHPTLEVAFLPGSYYGSRWAQEAALDVLDRGLDPRVPMLLSGAKIVPSSVSLDDFPVLPSKRRIVFYDNWAAVDTNARLPWELGRSSAPLPGELFGNGDARGHKWGYVLNPSFPLERNIHQIARVAQLHNDPFGAKPSPRSAGAIAPAAQSWAEWLVAHGFASAAKQDAVRAALDSAITANQWFGSVADVESAYPALHGVFSAPPTTAAPATATQTAPTPTTVPSTWCVSPDKYSAGYAGGVSTTYTLAGAKAACLAHPLCKAVTCGSTGCTMRQSGILSASAGETTHMPCATAAPTTAAPTPSAPTTSTPTTAAPTTATPATGPSTTAAPTFIGCYADDVDDRALPAFVGTATSAADCGAMCAAEGAGYDHFGLQWHKECWCGSAASYGKHGAASTCDCRDEATNHGGGVNCVYHVAAPTASAPTTSTPMTAAPTTAAPTTAAPTTAAPATDPSTTTAPTFIGCYADDGDDRALPAFVGTATSAADCDAMCAAEGAGYDHFGLQWHKECWCGNAASYGKHGAASTCDCRDEATNHGGGVNCVYGSASSGTSNAARRAPATSVERSGGLGVSRYAWAVLAAVGLCAAAGFVAWRQRRGRAVEEEADPEVDNAHPDSRADSPSHYKAQRDADVDV